MLGALGLAAVGCGKVSEAAPSAAGAQGATAAPNAAEPPAPRCRSFDNANYSAKIASAGPCKKDQTCAAEVVVEAKGEYHINDKYPYRFKLEDPPPAGLKYPKPVDRQRRRHDGRAQSELKVPFVPVPARATRKWRARCRSASARPPIA